MHSIRAKILAIVLVFLAFTGAAFVLYSVLTTANYEHLRRDGIEKTVGYETEKVNTKIAEIGRSAIFIAIDGGFAYKTQSEDRGKDLVLDYLLGFPTVLGMGFWFEPYTYNQNTLRAGVYAFRDKDTGAPRLDDTFVMSEYDYHSTDWYREIISAIEEPGQVVWTKPYVDDTGSYALMTTAGAGFFEQNGKIIAISTVDWEIEEVIDELSTIKPTENSFVLLCAPEQDYIITSTSASISTGASLKSLPWDINAESFNFDGNTYLSFSRFMDNGWFLSVLIPENEIYYEVVKQNNRFSLIIVLFSLIMLGVAYYLIAKLINAPIRRLTTDVSQVALGNLDARVDMAYMASNDELGLLARTFNQMTVDLKESIEENQRERAEVERISAELNVASEIQASMLPCAAFPPFPKRMEFDIFASMRPAKEVGGDFYDFFLADKNNLAVVIADVSGKGVPAALFMVNAKTLIKNIAISGKGPGEVMATVNKALCENNDAGMFVTAVMGYFNWESGRFVYVNAGHNPPLLKKRGQGYQFIQSKPCTFLAFMEDAEFREEEITLGSGDVLYLYTDGVTEAMNPELELFSDPRLLTVINKYKDSPIERLLPSIKQEIDDFARGADQSDDITMLALKVHSAGWLEMDEITVDANMQNLEIVTGFVNDVLMRHNYPEGTVGDIDVALEEIFVNIMSYAYHSEPGDVTISVQPQPPGIAGDNASTGAENGFIEEVVISFMDAGQPFNPLEKDDPDLEQPLAERKIGGLGIYLVKQLMDKVEYNYRDHKNVLTITKRK